MRMFACLLLVLSAICSSHVRALELPHSSLEWREPAQPQKYFDATGRRAAAFGRQTGQFEAWVYPIKVLHGFGLEFEQEGMIEPVRGEALLREAIARPESTTLVYAHPLFTINSPKNYIWDGIIARMIWELYYVK